MTERTLKDIALARISVAGGRILGLDEAVRDVADAVRKSDGAAHRALIRAAAAIRDNECPNDDQWKAFEAALHQSETDTRPPTEGRGVHEPVAWRVKDGDGSWVVTADRALAVKWALRSTPVQPLYASPIREPEISEPVSDPYKFGSDDVVRYIARYGGMCRACADEDGICPTSGLPCENTDKAIRSVLEALSYGLKHGHVILPAAAILNLAPVGGRGEGWRPIETAEPKNSERLMVATADTPPVVGEAWWREDYDGKLDLWWAGEGPGDYHADPIRDRNQRVTHWQPLPPPPQEQGGMK